MWRESEQQRQSERKRESWTGRGRSRERERGREGAAEKQRERERQLHTEIERVGTYGHKRGACIHAKIINIRIYTHDLTPKIMQTE